MVSHFRQSPHYLPFATSLWPHPLLIFFFHYIVFQTHWPLCWLCFWTQGNVIHSFSLSGKLFLGVLNGLLLHLQISTHIIYQKVLPWTLYFSYVVPSLSTLSHFIFIHFLLYDTFYYMTFYLNAIDSLLQGFFRICST